jgi:hypothetical protein
MVNEELISRLENLEKELARLKDIEAIRNLKAEHALASDDPENLAKRLLAIVTDDIELDYGEAFGVHKGIEIFKELVQDTPFIWTLHYMIPSKIEIAADGKTAKGIWYLWEPATTPSPVDAKETAMWLAGVYHDSYRKMPNGDWKISKMQLDSKLLCTYKDGWEKERIIDLSKSKWTENL